MKVQAVIKARVKKKTLAKQGYEYPNGGTVEEDSIAFAHELEVIYNTNIYRYTKWPSLEAWCVRQQWPRTQD